MSFDETQLFAKDLVEVILRDAMTYGSRCCW